MSFEYAEEVYRIDPSKIIQEKYSKVYTDTLLCDTDKIHIIQYRDEQLLIVRKRFVPFVNVNCSEMIVRNQLLSSEQVAIFNRLKGIDTFFIRSKKAEEIPLEPIEQRILGLPSPSNVTLRFKKEEVVLYLTNAIKPYIQ